MRRLALAIGILGFGLTPAAFAADMPVKAPAIKAVPMPAAYNWTGFYIGAHGGYASGSSHWIDDPSFGGTDLGSHDISGGFGGGQVGYNWQTGSWVFGVEGSASAADLTGSHVDVFVSDLHTKVDFLASVTGRVGYVWNAVLIYGKGGAAWEDVKYEDFTGVGLPLNGAKSTTRFGWMWGGGVEYGFLPGWSVFVEYNGYDFANESYAFSGGVGGNFTQTIHDRIDAVKFGVNFRFGAI